MHRNATNIVEVFKTNVLDDVQAAWLITLLLAHFPGNRINFDLEDCDKILRIQGNDFIPERIMSLVNDNGFTCTVLE